MPAGSKHVGVTPEGSVPQECGGIGISESNPEGYWETLCDLETKMKTVMVAGRGGSEMEIK